MNLGSDRQWERIARVLREGRLTRRGLLGMATAVAGAAAVAVVAAPRTREGTAASPLPDVAAIQVPMPIAGRAVFEHVHRPTRLMLVAESVGAGGGGAEGRVQRG